MPYYMMQVAYTSEAWGNILANQQNRLEMVKPVVAKLGGKIENGWMCFGDYDLVTIIQMPNNVDAAAFSLAASAGGAIKALKTTPLLTMEEGMEAMRKAAGAGYRAPKPVSHSG
jgi:uncharacterized protein with GYD domain